MEVLISIIRHWYLYLFMFEGFWADVCNIVWWLWYIGEGGRGADEGRMGFSCQGAAAASHTCTNLHIVIVCTIHNLTPRNFSTVAPAMALPIPWTIRFSAASTQHNTTYKNQNVQNFQNFNRLNLWHCDKKYATTTHWNLHSEFNLNSATSISLAPLGLFTCFFRYTLSILSSRIIFHQKGQWT